MDAFISAIQDFLTPLPVWDARGETNMPLFSTSHQLWLIICILLTLLVAFYHRQFEGQPKARRRLELFCAWMPIALLALHIALMVAWGAFHPGCLPLHLCNLAEMLAAMHSLRRDEFSGNVLYGIGLLGAVAALVFSGWTTAPAFSLPAVCGFLEHTLMADYIIMKLMDKSIRPTFAHIWQPLVFTGIYAAAIWPFNKACGTNFAFINWPLPGTPLEMWADMYGNPGYVAAFAVMFVLIELALFLPWKAKEGS